jgi:outer membrane cobalamin receptor
MWTHDLRSTLTLVYVGQRWTDLANTRTVDAFVDLRVSVVYSIDRAFDVQLTGENLVNSNVVLWNNYRGRGIFASIGLLWKF